MGLRYEALDYHRAPQKHSARLSQLYFLYIGQSESKRHLCQQRNSCIRSKDCSRLERREGKFPGLTVECAGGGVVVSDEEYRQLAERIVSAIRMQEAPSHPRATMDYLAAQVICDREILRAAVSDLIVRGELQVTPDLRVTAPSAR